MKDTTPSWAKGMRQISPGCYVDAERTLYFDRDELCIACRVPISDENANAIIEGIRKGIEARARHRAVAREVSQEAGKD